MVIAFEAAFEKACCCDDGILPGVVLSACDITGKVKYLKAFGAKNRRQGSPNDPINTDSIFWVASGTKTMTTVAALQCVEKGLFTLDEDSTGIITLRQLLNHSSGIVYDIFNPSLIRYRACQGKPPRDSTAKVVIRHLHPLLFEPGTKFEYGAGIDWAGVMVERATNMELQDYFQKHIWAPLGIQNATFHLEEREDLRSRLPDMTIREGGWSLFGTPNNPNGKVIYSSNRFQADPVPDAAGGGGMYISAPDYQTFLNAILTLDSKIMGKESFDVMFEPSLSESAQNTLTDLLKTPEVNTNMTCGLPMGNDVTWGLGGMLYLQDASDRPRKKGTLAWSGSPNCMWWVDRESGIAGFYASQLMPSGDPISKEFFGVFERGVYEMLKVS